LYHKSREEFLEIFIGKINEIKERIINNEKNNKKYLFILDDNFYFKSMRKPFYKLIKEIQKDFMKSKYINNNIYIFSYLEIILKCQLNYALENNYKRNNLEKIPELVIRRMQDKIEYESFIKNFVYIINITDKDTLSLYNLKNMNFIEKIFIELIYSKLIIQEVIKDEIKNEFLNSKDNPLIFDSFKETKNNQNDVFQLKFNRINFIKKNFLNDFENALRKKIGEIFKNNNAIINKINVKILKDHLSLKTKLNDLSINFNNININGKINEKFTSEIIFHIAIGIYYKNKNVLVLTKKSYQRNENNAKSFPIKKNNQISKIISNIKDQFSTLIKNYFFIKSNSDNNLIIKGLDTTENIKILLNDFFSAEEIEIYDLRIFDNDFIMKSIIYNFNFS